MKLTRTHVSYWRERQRDPQWVTALLLDAERRGASARVSIDTIVNLNADTLSRGRTLDARNLVHVLRLARKNDGGTVVPALVRMANDMRTHAANSTRRRAHARKWLRLITERHKQ